MGNESTCIIVQRALVEDDDENLLAIRPRKDVQYERLDDDIGIVKRTRRMQSRSS